MRTAAIQVQVRRERAARELARLQWGDLLQRAAQQYRDAACEAFGERRAFMLLPQYR